ncbi:T9SS type A sorting domain-containing protein [Calditrichota bacterium]
MTFTKRVLIAVLTLCLSSLVLAQVTIDYEDFSTPSGTRTTSMESESGITLDVGSDGADQTWDYSEIIAEGERIRVSVSPDTIPGAASFPDANFVEYEQGPPEATTLFYSFGRIDETGYYQYGLSIYFTEQDTTYIVPFETSGPIYTFPLEYGDEWLYTHEFDFSGTQIDSMHFNIDAWGSVTDQAGTFDCLRLQTFTKGYEEEDDTLSLHDQQYSYTFLSPGNGMICSMDSDDSDVNPDFTLGEFSRTTEVIFGKIKERLLAELPGQSNLDPAYPNPFNPNTQLMFNVTQPGDVTIDVYDVNGRMVTSLVNGFFGAGGYKADFDASSLSSGVYFARFNTGNVNQTQRLILMK